MSTRIIIFDTTLRDGEQSPGVSLNIQEKLRIAVQLAKLKVDVIEAGFPVASEGEFLAVRQIAKQIEGPEIAALARALPSDIDRAWEAVKYAGRPKIHTFIATSDIHLRYKLKKTRAEVLEAAKAAVSYAKHYTKAVEFSAEDATRSDREFLCRVIEEAVRAGATTINIPDTVGYALPWEFAELIRELLERAPALDKATLSVHCHNDLGLAVANSLAAVQVGVRQVECTVNGLGERAGNAALEEVVMSAHTRQDLLPLELNVDMRQIYRTSKLVSELTGMVVQRNKAIVGENAFAHEAGIHQDGMLKEKTTYEIMTPASIGLEKSQLVLGKHSGRHAFRDRLNSLGYDLQEEELNKIFHLFKGLADKKKVIYDDDIRALINDEVFIVPETYKLDYIYIICGNQTVPEATVRLKKGEETFQGKAGGDGPVDAAYNAIDQITKEPGHLLEYSVHAVTHDKDAMGEVRVKVNINGQTIFGKGASTDIIEASAKAYLHAINRNLFERKRG